jgi:hypothetical protein
MFATIEIDNGEGEERRKERTIVRIETEASPRFPTYRRVTKESVELLDVMCSALTEHYGVKHVWRWYI